MILKNLRARWAPGFERVYIPLVTGAMAVCFDTGDDGGGGGSTEALQELTSEVKSFKDEQSKRLDVVVQQNTDFREDLSQLQAQVKDVKENGGSLDKKALEEAVTGILDKMDAQRVRARTSGGMPGAGAKTVVPDVWKAGGVGELLSSGGYDQKSLLQKGKKGLDFLVSEAPAFDDDHRNLMRLAVDVKLAHDVARLTTPGYPGFRSFFPKLSAFWAKSVEQYAAKYDVDLKVSTAPMDLTDTADWVPTGWTAEVRELITAKLVAAGLFDVIPMPQSPYTMPIDVTDTLPDFIPETTTNASPFSDDYIQQLVDKKCTFTAKKLRSRMLVSGELDEDSIVPMLPRMRTKMIMTMANGRETAALNGDTAATHFDTDVAAITNDCRKAVLGMRAYCIDNTYTTDHSGAAASVAGLRGLRKSMGEYGLDNTRLAYIMSISSYIDLLDDTLVKTVDKLGMLATLLNGQLAALDGIPIVVSRYQRQDITANGYNEASGNTLTSVLLAHRDAWLWGDRRRQTLEAERIIVTDQTQVVAFERLDLQNVYGNMATPPAVVYMLRNVSN